MLQIFIFLSLWTLVHGVVLAVVTTTVSTGAISAAATSFPTSLIPQSACIFTSTLDVSSNTVSVCECSSTIIAGISLAVSGSSTTSYCALGGPVPTGFSQVSATDDQPLPTLYANSTSCSSSPATQSGAAIVGTNASITTSKSPFTTLTGTHSKTSAPASATGSGAFKNGMGMCLGLLATTLVAVFLL